MKECLLRKGPLQLHVCSCKDSHVTETMLQETRKYSSHHSVNCKPNKCYTR